MSRSSFVCLRCQLRRNTPRQRQILAGPTGQFRRHSGATSSGTRDAGRNGEPTGSEHFQNTASVRKGHGSLRDPEAPTSSEFFLSQGKRLLMKSEKLSIDMLGQPAKAIVMKNVGTLRRRAPATTWAELVEAAGEAPGTLEALADENKPVTPKEVEANINELRPRDSDIITEREFKKIAAQLHDGFTIGQLQEYIQKNEGKPRGRTSLLCWVPAAAAEEGTDLIMQGYIHEHSRQKPRIAVELMRKCWNVSIQELMEGPGCLHVKFIRNDEFDLLMLGTQGWLQTLSRHFSRPGDHVELFPSEKTMRIIASLAVAETILSEVYRHLSRIKTRTLVLDPPTFKALTGIRQREIGQITNSHLRVRKSRREVDVCWVEMEDNSSGLEDVGDIVFRLILGAFGNKRMTTKLYTCPQEGVSGKLVLHFVGKETVAWNARSTGWKRWTAPEYRQQVKLQTGAMLPPKILPWDVESPASGSSVIEQHGWPSQPTTVTRAVFGHILLSQLRFELFNCQPKFLSSQRCEFYERIISPILPPVHGLPPELSRQVDTLPPTLVLRFLPNPADPHAAHPHGLSAPILELELELELDASGAQAGPPIALHAITATHHDDLQFHKERIDVRLIQTRVSTLPGSSISALPGLQPLLDFVARSRLRLDEGSLATPAALPQLGLPRHLFAPYKNLTPADNVDYLFAGLEVRRRIASSYHGWRLLFTTVEAGKGGGRRTEMSLEAVPSGISNDTTTAVPGEERHVSSPAASGTTTEENGAAVAGPETEAREGTCGPDMPFLDAIVALVQGQEIKWMGTKE